MMSTHTSHSTLKRQESDAAGNHVFRRSLIGELYADDVGVFRILADHVATGYEELVAPLRSEVDPRVMTIRSSSSSATNGKYPHVVICR